MSSTIIVIAGENDNSLFDFFGDEEDEEESLEEGVSVGVTKKEDVMEEVKQSSKNSVGLIAISGTMTIILFVSLLILLVIYSKSYNKKGAIKQKKSGGQ